MKAFVISTYPEFLQDEVDRVLKMCETHDFTVVNVVQSSFTDEDCEPKDMKICMTIFYQ